MWYSRIKTAISKQTAEDIIQSELRSGSYVDPATEDAETIRTKLIEKYGSEEAMLEAINDTLRSISTKLTGSSMADPSRETSTYFQELSILTKFQAWFGVKKFKRENSLTTPKKFVFTRPTTKIQGILLREQSSL